MNTDLRARMEKRRIQNDANRVGLRNKLDMGLDSKNITGSALRGNVPALLNAIRAGRFDVAIQLV